MTVVPTFPRLDQSNSSKILKGPPVYGENVIAKSNLIMLMVTCFISVFYGEDYRDPYLEHVMRNLHLQNNWLLRDNENVLRVDN